MKKKYIAFSDIDGTIIQKVPREDEKIYDAKKELIKVSQTKHGCSYMTISDNKLLQELDNDIEFVFTTSRGEESFRTINLGFTPKNALIEGGSILLTNGIRNSDWDAEIKQLLGENYSVIQYLRQKVCSLGYDMKYEHNEYILDFLDSEYIKTKDDKIKREKFEKTIAQLHEMPEVSNNFNIYSHSNGMFIVNKKLEKGEMIKKYINKFSNIKNTVTMSMGDSKTDSTMFHVTDYSFGPKGSGATNEYEITGTFDSKIGFTKYILDGIKNIIIKEQRLLEAQ